MPWIYHLSSSLCPPYSRRVFRGSWIFLSVLFFHLSSLDTGNDPLHLGPLVSIDGHDMLRVINKSHVLGSEHRNRLWSNCVIHTYSLWSSLLSTYHRSLQDDDMFFGCVQLGLWYCTTARRFINKYFLLRCGFDIFFPSSSLFFAFDLAGSMENNVLKDTLFCFFFLWLACVGVWLANDDNFFVDL